MEFEPIYCRAKYLGSSLTYLLSCRANREIHNALISQTHQREHMPENHDHDLNCGIQIFLQDNLQL